MSKQSNTPCQSVAETHFGVSQGSIITCKRCANIMFNNGHGSLACPLCLKSNLRGQVEALNADL